MPLVVWKLESQHPVKLKNLCKITDLMRVPGFIGPKGFKDITIIADNTVKDLKNFVVGM